MRDEGSDSDKQLTVHVLLIEEPELQFESRNHYSGSITKIKERLSDGIAEVIAIAGIENYRLVVVFHQCSAKLASNGNSWRCKDNVWLILLKSINSFHKVREKIKKGLKSFALLQKRALCGLWCIFILSEI